MASSREAVVSSDPKVTAFNVPEPVPEPAAATTPPVAFSDPFVSADTTAAGLAALALNAGVSAGGASSLQSANVASSVVSGITSDNKALFSTICRSGFNYYKLTFLLK